MLKIGEWVTVRSNREAVNDANGYIVRATEEKYCVRLVVDKEGYKLHGKSWFLKGHVSLLESKIHPDDLNTLIDIALFHYPKEQDWVLELTKRKLSFFDQELV
jgi:hypothetical protein